MTTCASFRELVTAYVDGEIVGGEQSAIRSHLGVCPACRRLLDEELASTEMLQRAQTAPGAPPGLRERVEALMGTAVRGGARRNPRLGLAAAALALGLGILLAGYGVRGTKAAGASELAALAADTHLRYATGKLPLEVSTERPEQVSRFFSGRVPFHLTLPDYPVGPGEEKFYQLEGGRLVSFRKDYAAYVAYRMEGQPVSLLVTTADNVQPQGGEIVTSGKLSFHLESVAGLQVITWSDKGLTYALASDVAVSGERSCMVCHGSRAERSRVQGFPGRPRT